MKEGDRILFGKYSGTEIKIDGEDFLIMREEEVLGILTGAAKKEARRSAALTEEFVANSATEQLDFQDILAGQTCRQSIAR